MYVTDVMVTRKIDKIDSWGRPGWLVSSRNLPWITMLLKVRRIIHIILIAISYTNLTRLVVPRVILTFLTLVLYHGHVDLACLIQLRIAPVRPVVAVAVDVVEIGIRVVISEAGYTHSAARQREIRARVECGEERMRLADIILCL